MALTKITKQGIGADAIDATKIPDDAISEEHLDVTAITGHTEETANAAANDILLIYDSSSASLKKIQASKVGLSIPTLTSVSPTSVVSGDGTGNYTFTITGTGFVTSATTTTATLVNASGTTINFDSQTLDSATQITAVIAKSNLGTVGEPYDVRVTVGGEVGAGLTATLENQINVDQSPTFNTAAGNLGSFAEQSTVSTMDIEAFDPDSAGNISFELQSGSLPPGLSATTVHENGVSKYRITGTLTTDRSGLTTTTFVVRAVDAASNTSSRSFNIVETPSGTESFTSSGTFSVPTGVSNLIELLVVGGGGSGGQRGGNCGTGGGGAGGLVYIPNAPVTPGGTVTVTVGDGGAAGGGTGQDTTFGSPGDPGLHPSAGVITAKGGGGGGGPSGPHQNPGGSGNGGAGGTFTPALPNAQGWPNYSAQYGGGGGLGIQPTQPGFSGAYGFGNRGGAGGARHYPAAGGGGGGAGAVGEDGQNSYPSPNPNIGGGDGGAGKAYTIADGTTSVYYAGGGGGAQGDDRPDIPVPAARPAGLGAQGGGTDGNRGGATTAAQANKGGGSGGTRAAYASGAGGKGIVILRY